MPIPPLPDAAVELRAPAADWREAVRLAGAALTRSGAAAPSYADSMVALVERHGPYIVIAPGLALAHARSDGDVHADGLAVVTLAEPVAFGHPHNDPVRVVLGLALGSVARQIGALSALANVFNDSDAVARIAAADSAEEVRSVLGVAASEPAASS
ncbi:MAG: PTS sugar transporter subunit IIA [Actinomycetales bacterium]|nr:PTS sugar transporter subunit IIA [Actinomycetales bacterium]